MKRLLGFAAMLAMVLLAWGGDQTPPSPQKVPAKKSAPKPGTSKTGTSKTGASKTAPAKKQSGPAKKTPVRAARRPAASPARKGPATASRRPVSVAGKKAPAKKAPAKRAATWRNRQTAPTPERYREIQEALVAKGYLKSEDATGAWNQTSADALKKFQEEQNLDPSGKVNSLSLIALGLGPKHDATAAAPPPKPPQEPPPTGR